MENRQGRSIVFSPHAELKIRQRKIPRELILRTISEPDFATPSYGQREVLFKKFDKNYLKVITARSFNQITVITIHWVAKLRSK